MDRLRTPEEIMQILQSNGVPAGIVENMQDVHSDPQLSYRNHFPKILHPEMGIHAIENNGFRLSNNTAEIKTPPCLGEHNEYVYKKLLGMSEEEYVQLILDGALE